MSLFGFGNKKDCCGTACGCSAENSVPAEAVGARAQNIETEASGKISVKVLGSGCKRCHDLLESAEKAVASVGWNSSVEYITDYEKIAGYGAMSMPALVVNEKLVSCGKVLNAEEIARLLKFIKP